MAEAGESEAVLAFIRERQAAVLAEAIRQLSACTPDELPAVAHAVAGSLGSYQIQDAFESVARLRSVLTDDSTSGGDVERAWATTLDDLRAIEAESPT